MMVLKISLHLDMLLSWFRYLIIINPIIPNPTISRIANNMFILGCFSAKVNSILLVLSFIIVFFPLLPSPSINAHILNCFGNIIYIQFSHFIFLNRIQRFPEGHLKYSLTALTLYITIAYLFTKSLSNNIEWSQ